MRTLRAIAPIVFVVALGACSKNLHPLRVGPVEYLDVERPERVWVERPDGEQVLLFELERVEPDSILGSRVPNCSRSDVDLRTRCDDVRAALGDLRVTRSWEHFAASLGDTARIRVSGDEIRGSLRGVGSGFLNVNTETSGIRSIPLEAVERIDVLRGTRPAWKEGALFGYLAGIVGAAVYWQVHGVDWTEADYGASDTWMIGGYLLGIGGLIGAVPGIFIGSTVRVDSWQRASIPRRW